MWRISSMAVQLVLVAFVVVVFFFFQANGASWQMCAAYVFAWLISTNLKLEIRMCVLVHMSLDVLLGTKTSVQSTVAPKEDPSELGSVSLPLDGKICHLLRA